MSALVVKLGGSLLETGRLAAALGLVAKATRPVVIVPGGGPFADAVREAQTRLGFSDPAAHRLALLAMHQTAVVMRELQPGLVPTETLAAIRKSWSERRRPVWMPYRLAHADRRIPADWSITSDGLAARLAERLGGHTAVVLVKSVPVSTGASAKELAAAGVVDRAFADILERASLHWRVLGPGEENELARLVGAGPQSGRGVARSGAKKGLRQPSTVGR